MCVSVCDGWMEGEEVIVCHCPLSFKSFIIILKTEDFFKALSSLVGFFVKEIGPRAHPPERRSAT